MEAKVKRLELVVILLATLSGCSLLFSVFSVIRGRAAPSNVLDATNVTMDHDGITVRSLDNKEVGFTAQAKANNAFMAVGVGDKGLSLGVDRAKGSLVTMMAYGTTVQSWLEVDTKSGQWSVVQQVLDQKMKPIKELRTPLVPAISP